MVHIIEVKFECCSVDCCRIMARAADRVVGGRLGIDFSNESISLISLSLVEEESVDS